MSEGEGPNNQHEVEGGRREGGGGRDEGAGDMQHKEQHDEKPGSIS